MEQMYTSTHSEPEH